MLTFLSVHRAGHDDKGNLIFSMVADDNKRYDFAITTETFMRLFVMGWQAAKDLPPAGREGESVGLTSQASFAIVNMQPGLILQSGALTMSLAVGEQEMAYLLGEFQAFQAKSGGSRQH